VVKVDLWPQVMQKNLLFLQTGLCNLAGSILQMELFIYGKKSCSAVTPLQKE
jgi:hypothetical protein